MSPPDSTNMMTCPFCQTALESWQISCHSCGQSVSSFEIPIIKSDIAPDTDLAKAYKKWMTRGRSAFNAGSYDEAQACFAEGLKRVHGLDRYRKDEIKAREQMAQAYLKLNKVEAAVEQLVKAEGLCIHEPQKKRLQERIDELTCTPPDNGAQFEFRAPREGEYMSAPLYCASCMRLMFESEVYRFRYGKQNVVTCMCGFSGLPLTASVPARDSMDLLATELPITLTKAQVIEAAQQPVGGGKDRKNAFWLALVFGGLGVHKFYLGERTSGYVYLTLFLVPVLLGAYYANPLMMAFAIIPVFCALYEAVLLFQMTRVAFNLVYNIEAVVERLPKDDSGSSEQSGVFSMVITAEEPDDLVDDWSGKDEA